MATPTWTSVRLPNALVNDMRAITQACVRLRVVLASRHNPRGPFGLYIHGNEGTEGAERGVNAITTGLGWLKAAETVVVMGKPSKADLESCWELGATVAAQLME